MKLRSTPVVDACFNLGLTLPLIFLVIFVAQGLQAATDQVSVVAMIYLMPAFTLQILGGFLTRRKSRTSRFIMTLAVSLLIAAAVTYIAVAGIGLDATLEPQVILQVQQSWILVSVVYFTSQLFAAMLTHFVLTKDALAPTSTNQLGRQTKSK